LPNPEVGNTDEVEYLLTEVKRLHQIRKDAHKFITRAQTKQKENFDKANRGAETFNIGDQVLLYRDVVESSWSAKLEPRWEGHYLVRKINDNKHWLRRVDGTILTKTVHRNRLKRYYDRQSV